MKNSVIAILFIFISSLSYCSYVDTQVPSSSAGSTGLMTRIFIPDTTRFTSGAPVVIYLQGGNVIDNVDTSSRFTRFGFIVITFNYPGGTGSGGTYDNRGINCLTALKDIIKFAAGQIQDNSGRYLNQITYPKISLYTNVGILGSSNGGNITIAAAGYFGQELNLSWIANWESPVGEEMPGAELGRRGNSNGNPFTNPAYNDTTGVIDYTKLKFSDTVTVYNQSTPFHGGFYYDMNNNNVPNRGTDYIVNGYWVVNYGVLRGIVSARLIREAINRGVYPSSPPSHIPQLTEADDFWQLRTGDRWIDSVKAKLPNIMFMVTASDSDHVQSAKDHPHVFNQYEKFRAAAPRFVRLNPDRAYIEYITGQSQGTCPDNNAFEQFTHISIRSKLMPETVSDINYQAAGICELADRTCSGNTNPNLPYVIYCNTLGVTQLGNEIPGEDELKQNYPNPFNPVTNIEFKIPRRTFAELKIFDVTGKLIDILLSSELQPGTYSAKWNALNYSSGVYLYLLVTSEFTQTKRMMLIK
ncbi:MAG: T9SS type A sorting domain-containing protein [Ignavibacteria bacterium]|nr:T9SS type A sorting domain-containing protein [Ignavibacteria bacterium]